MSRPNVVLRPAEMPVRRFAGLRIAGLVAAVAVAVGVAVAAATTGCGVDLTTTSVSASGTIGGGSDNDGAGGGNNSGNDGTGGSTTIAFNNLRAEDVGATSAIIRFTTSVETTCEVEYGTAASALDSTAQDPNMDPGDPYALDHDVPLTGLSASTTYHYRARAETRSGTVAFSNTTTFATAAANTNGSNGANGNVALANAGTTISSVSSNFGQGSNSSTWGANNAIDGSMATEWSSHGDGNDVSITLDLGQTRTLTQFGFRSRKMFDGSAIITQVQLTWPGAGNTTNTAGPFDTPDPDTTYLFDLSPAITSQQITVEAVASTGGNTGAKEIQLFEAAP